jgi:hypothetical protein
VFFASHCARFYPAFGALYTVFPANLGDRGLHYNSAKFPGKLLGDGRLGATLGNPLSNLFNGIVSVGSHV